jgi:hypothetical protein
VAGSKVSCEAKIIWLPDRSEEYAISMNSGLWGSSSAKPQLQDGWNLTSLDASADSKTAEVLNGFAAVLKSLPAGWIGTTALKNGPAPKTSLSKCAGLYRALFDRAGHIYGFREVNTPTPVVISIPGPAPAPSKTCPKGEPPPCKE